MVAILLALGSSVGYGVSDFLASRVAKRVAPVLLVFYSQALQSVVLLVAVVAVRQPYSGAVLPLLVDLAGEERPSPLALAGLVLVLGGIAVTSLASAEREGEA